MIDMVTYLFALLALGCSEKDAIEETAYKYHKKELFGNDIQDSIKILSEMYNGKKG